MTVLITGASGFVGRHLCAHLTANGHDVLAMLRSPQHLPELRERITSLGGKADRLQALAGNLDYPDLRLTGPLLALDAIVHLGARFGWGLNPGEAHRTNVQGSLAVAGLARELDCRLVFISGFMLENHDHLSRLGIHRDAPSETDWRRVYRRAGAYEASKLEAALKVREYARENGLDSVEVQPATVAGHSVTGELDPAQPLFGILDNLASGRLALVPGSPDHWLPLVAVDQLTALIAAATLCRQPPARLLALDRTTPALRELLALFARELGRQPPRRHLPMPVLAALLRIPGLPALMNTAPEALHFIQTARFDTAVTDAFMADQGLTPAPTEAVLRATARHYREQVSS